MSQEASQQPADEGQISPQSPGIPRVTVLMPVYNGLPYLPKAVESIFQQTYRGFELLIINDGSTDGTKEYLDSLNEPRVRVIHLASNVGLSKALNLGLAEARGELIARMDADDVSLPERLERQAAYLDGHHDVGVVGSACWRVNQNGGGRLYWSMANQHGFLRWYLFFQNPLIHPAVMMRKDLIRAHDGYRCDLPHAEDFDLWSRLSGVTRLAVLPEPLLELRIHSDSVSQKFQAAQQESCLRLRSRSVKDFLGKENGKSWLPARTLDEQYNLIEALYEAYTKQVRLNPEERSLVNADAAQRMLLLSLKKGVFWQRQEARNRAQELDTGCLWRLGSWPVRRYLFHKLENSILRP